MLNYKAIEIFTNEEARCHNKPTADAVIDYIRGLKIAARCIVTRGIAGCYESGEISTGRLEILSYNLPIRIYIALPAAETEKVTAELETMVEEGIIVLHDLQVISHKTANTFFPRQLLVQDVMTADPQKVSAETPASEAARLLLSSIFTGLPVVDRENRPIGMVTQGDLIEKGGMPLRLGLLAESEQDGIESVMKALAQKQAREIMTAPAVTIGQDRTLIEAVGRMFDKGLKRLPAVDKEGHLTGMLSRLDIFKTVMREAPDWAAFQAQKIKVQNLRTVSDILRRDTQAVSPETTIDTVIRIINGNDMQRVVVVDAEGRLLGMISDRDLLGYFKADQDGIRQLFTRLAHPFKKASQDLAERLAGTTAGEVMTTDPITVREGTLIGEAIRLMTDKRLKRLPVVDESNRFQGMISRDSLLRTGFARKG